MRNRKTSKGFTLVELIVVIAIIGVLAAILVPSMTSYVESSKFSSANANAKTAYNAAIAFTTERDVAGKTITDDTYSTGKLADLDAVIKEKTGAKGKPEYVAYVEGGSVIQIWFAASDSDRYVGGYPYINEGYKGKLNAGAATVGDPAKNLTTNANIVK